MTVVKFLLIQDLMKADISMTKVIFAQIVRRYI